MMTWICPAAQRLERRLEEVHQLTDRVLRGDPSPHGGCRPHDEHVLRRLLIVVSYPAFRSAAG